MRLLVHGIDLRLGALFDGVGPCLRRGAVFKVGKGSVLGSYIAGQRAHLWMRPRAVNACFFVFLDAMQSYLVRRAAWLFVSNFEDAVCLLRKVVVRGS